MRSKKRPSGQNANEVAILSDFEEMGPLNEWSVPDASCELSPRKDMYLK